MKLGRIAGTALTTLMLGGCATGSGSSIAMTPQTASSEIASGDLLVFNVTVIDPQRDTVLANHDVLVDDDRIARVVPHGSVAISASRKVDGTGRYLMPGLFDMHSHSSFAPVHLSSLKLMRANGVTGVREMGSDCADGAGGIALCIDRMLQSRAAIEAGDIVGPRLLMLASAKVDSNRKEGSEGLVAAYTPTTAEQARQTVEILGERNAELIKVSQEMMPEAFAGLLEAANGRNMPIGGHIPMMYSVAQVSQMGMSSVEHARDLPVDCSTYGATYRSAIAAALKGEGEWPERARTPGEARDTFDPAICAAQVQAMAKNGTYYVPTHVTREFDVRAGDEEYVTDSRRKYLPPMQLQFWQGDIDRTAAMPPEMVADLADFFELGLRTTRIAHEAGVKVMVGTDANDTMIFPGFSVHDELGHLVAAGLTPMEALRAATSVPAEYLGRQEDFGGVSEGKIADLVLLSADPTADIDNSDAIEAVIFGGTFEDRTTLDRYLEDVLAFVARAEAAR